MTPPPTAETFPIVLTRPAKAGDAADVRILVDNTCHATVTVGEEPTQHKNDILRAYLIARREILHVDDRGDADHFTLTVTSFTDGDGNALAQPGEVFTIQRTSAAVEVTSSAAPPSDYVRQVFSAIYSRLKDADSPTDNEFFGTPIPQPVGGTWPINANAAARSARESKLLVEPADIAGTATLASATPTPIGPMLHITGEILAHNVKSPGIPPHAAIHESTLTTTFTGDYPADPAFPAARNSFVAVMRLAYSFDNVGATIDVRSEKIEFTTPIAR